MINNKLKLLTISLFVFALYYTSQAQAPIQTDPPMRQVIGSTGGSGVFTWGSKLVTIDYTVGEVMVTTDSITSPQPFSSFKFLTQGFQQPDNYGLSVYAVSVNSTCKNAKNGSINLSVINSKGPVTYSWQHLPYGANHLFENLGPGMYYYSVKDSSFSISDSVIIYEDPADCASQLIIYHGFTPNGDSYNDNWQIDGIENFEKNKVTIYNRWGDEVWINKEKYDNKNVVWTGTNTAGVQLPDATYFYVIDTDGKIYKGWVEITR